MELGSIGGNIRRYRVAKKLRQKDLAELTGLSINYVGAIERGEKIPALETLIDILNALDISADMVLCDVLKTGYDIKTSLLSEKIDRLPPEKIETVLDVVEVLIQHLS